MPDTHPELHQYPFLRISLSFISGMLIACFMPYWGIGIGFLLVAFLLKGISLLPACAYQKWMSGVELVVALVGCGFLTYFTYPQPYTLDIPPSTSYQATVLQNPVEKPKTYRLPCALKNAAGKEYGCVLYLQKDSASAQLQEGDLLWVRPISFQAQKSPYYLQQGLYSSAYVNAHRWKRIDKWEASPSVVARIQQMALQTRIRLLQGLEANTDSTTHSICSALCLGEKNKLSPTVKQNFANTGASHILAVSGLHVGIVYLAISWLLGFLPKTVPGKTIKAFGVILFLWGYAYICGLPPSILRAVIMFSIVTMGQTFHQHPKPINTVLFTAMALLIYHPPYLFNIGFQLSFAAVLSILLFYPLLNGLWYPTNPILHWGWSLICVSIAAQLGTAPLTLYYFHQFPLYFLLSNFWVVPLGTGLIYGSMGLWLLQVFPSTWGLSLPKLGIENLLISTQNMVGKILNTLTQILLQGVQKIGELPGAVIENIQLHKGEVLLLFGILLTAYLFVRKKRIAYLYGQLFMVILLLLGGIVQIISNIFFIFVD